MSFSDSRRIRRFCITLMPAIVALATLAFVPRAHAQGAKRAKHEIKIATLAPDGSTWMNLMTQMDQEIRQKTNGDVGLRWYAGGIQGDETVVLRKIRSGQLQGGGFTGVGLGQLAPSLRVLEVPFLFRNEDEVHAVHAKLDQTFESRLHDAGFTVLGWADVGFVYLYSKQPVASTRDLQSQKVWLWEGDPLAEAFLKAAGVSPVPLAITDVLTALQTGLVTAVYITPLANIGMQWFTRCSYTTDVPLTFSTGAVVVTNDSWDAIPEQEKPVVRDICRSYFDRLRQATSQDNKKSMDTIGRSGIKTVTPTPADLQSFEAIGEKVREELVGRLYDRQILDSVLGTVAEFRKSGGAGMGR